MRNSLPKIRRVVADNCRHLKALDSASDIAIARRGRVSAKTVNNLCNEATNPTLASIVAVADAYGVEPWRLLHPDFIGATPSPDDVDAMAKALAKMSDEDFAQLLRGDR